MNADFGVFERSVDRIFVVDVVRIEGSVRPAETLPFRPIIWMAEVETERAQPGPGRVFGADGAIQVSGPDKTPEKTSNRSQNEIAAPKNFLSKILNFRNPDR
jgi:hypothetical protein